MPNDTILNVHALGTGSAKATIPTFDRQSTSASASTSASLVKQRAPYLVKAPVFSGDHHTLYAPLPAMITLYDTWIDSLSWNAPGGVDEVIELRDAAGATIFRGVAQALDDSRFACVKIERFAKGGYQVPVLDSGRLDVTLGRRPRNA